MELIRPSEITGKIISLIEDATKFLVIVSPYNDFENWNRMVKCLCNAVSRNVPVKFYARADAHHKGMDLIGIVPDLVENLHAKIYINDQYAILSSMNLNRFADDNSIDFALKTQTKEEYAEVLEFFKMYIKPKSSGAPAVSLKEDILNEIPCARYFARFPELNHAGFEKEYYTYSGFIKALKFYNAQKELILKLDFSEDGLLTKVKSSIESLPSEEVIYNKNTSKYFLVLGMANITGGFFKRSIRDFYFQATLSPFTEGENDKLLRHLKKVLDLQFLEKECRTVDELADNIKKALHQRGRKTPFVS